MKPISKPRDTQNAKDEKENELNKKVEQFFNDVRTELENRDTRAKLNYCDDTTLEEFEKMVSDLKAGNTRFEFRLDLFEVVTKFYTYNVTKEKIINLFCEFLKNLIDCKDLVKPIEVLEYENYLKGLELIKIAINCETDEYCSPLDNFCEVVETPDIELKKEFYTFKGKADTFFKRLDYPKAKKDYEVKTSKQKINDNFNEQMYKIAELYQLPISENTYKRTLSNEITKYFFPKEKDLNDN